MGSPNQSWAMELVTTDSDETRLLRDIVFCGKWMYGFFFVRSQIVDQGVFQTIEKTRDDVVWRHPWRVHVCVATRETIHVPSDRKVVNAVRLASGSNMGESIWYLSR